MDGHGEGAQRCGTLEVCNEAGSHTKLHRVAKFMLAQGTTGENDYLMVLISVAST